jgi:hypothetical protein
MKLHQGTGVGGAARGFGCQTASLRSVAQLKPDRSHIQPDYIVSMYAVERHRLIALPFAEPALQLHYPVETSY